MAFRTNGLFSIPSMGGQHKKYTVEKWNWGNTTAFLARQSMSVQHHTKAHSCCRSCSGKINKYYIFWVCVCSLRYPAYNIACAILSSVPRPALQ